jgi:hypothetical protein
MNMLMKSYHLDTLSICPKVITKTEIKNLKDNLSKYYSCEL